MKCPTCVRAAKLGSMARANPIMASHPKCGWCGLLFGPGHIASKAGVVLGRKACGYCVSIHQRFGDRAFIHSKMDLVAENPGKDAPNEPRRV